MAYETDWSGQLHSTVHLYSHPQSVEVCLGSKDKDNLSHHLFSPRQSCVSLAGLNCATEDDLEYPIPLPSIPSAKIIGVHHHIWFMRLGMEPRALYMLGKHSTD